MRNYRVKMQDRGGRTFAIVVGAWNAFEAGETARAMNPEASVLSVTEC